MTEEALAVITSSSTGTLATLCEDGSPYTTPLKYTFKDGRFTWKSAPEAVHSMNIIRDGRASFCIVEDVANNVRAVYINGRAFATGEASFNEEWQTNLADYSIELGALDTTKSTPGRFYFQGANI